MPIEAISSSDCVCHCFGAIVQEPRCVRIRLRRFVEGIHSHLRCQLLERTGFPEPHAQLAAPLKSTAAVEFECACDIVDAARDVVRACGCNRAVTCHDSEVGFAQLMARHKQGKTGAEGQLLPESTIPC